tara:strand:- start:179 stop:574 length:396 start_codon:yes stop_codon:yes gene_type:complete
MKIFFCFLLLFINLKLVFAQEIECQGAVLRVLNKTTNEKNYFSVPLSQTIELNNASIVVHRCIKVEKKDKNDEIALLTHKFEGSSRVDKVFFGWIFKSTQYLNSPNNPVYDIKLEKCLLEDPIFLKNNETI